MGLKGAQDLEGRGEDADAAIVAAEEEVLGAGADAADLIVLEERPAVFVGGGD